MKNCIKEILKGADPIAGFLVFLLAISIGILRWLTFIYKPFSDLSIIYTKNFPLLFLYVLVISLVTSLVISTILHLRGLLIRTINLEKEKLEEMKKDKGTVYGNVIIGTKEEWDGLTEKDILLQMKDRLREIDVDEEVMNRLSSEDLEMVYLEKEECK